MIKHLTYEEFSPERKAAQEELQEKGISLDWMKTPNTFKQLKTDKLEIHCDEVEQSGKQSPDVQLCLGGGLND